MLSSVKAEELIITKIPQTPEQIHLDDLKYKNDKERGQKATFCFPRNDSLRNILKLTTIGSDSCIDVNCIAKKKEYNDLLNSYEIASINNIDSIRTNILFELLKRKYLELKSEEYNSQKIVKVNECDTSITNCKLYVLTSTDSSVLDKNLKLTDTSSTLYIEPINIAFCHFNKDKEIAQIVFNLQDDFMDFSIDKSLLDSLNLNSWITPLKLPFGYVSFKIVEKNICYPEYSDLQKIIQMAKFDKKIELPDSMNYLDSADTLFVKFWSQPVILKNKKSMTELDTAKVFPFQITGRELPIRVYKKVLEEFRKKGTVFFNNYKNDYCVWSLEILDYKKSALKNNVDSNTNYMISQKANIIINRNKTKNDEKQEAKSRNYYLSYLYDQYCLQNGCNKNGSQVPVEAIINTQKQLNLSAYKWIKENVFFTGGIFNESYISKDLTGK